MWNNQADFLTSSIVVPRRQNFEAKKQNDMTDIIRNGTSKFMEKRDPTEFFMTYESLKL